MLGTRESEAEWECLAQGNQRQKGVLGCCREMEYRGKPYEESGDDPDDARNRVFNNGQGIHMVCSYCKDRMCVSKRGREVCVYVCVCVYECVCVCMSVCV